MDDELFLEPTDPDETRVISINYNNQWHKDIADEERVHAGEFLRQLHKLASDKKKFYAKGEKEVEGEINGMNPRASPGS